MAHHRQADFKSGKNVRGTAKRIDEAQVKRKDERHAALIEARRGMRRCATMATPATTAAFDRHALIEHGDREQAARLHALTSTMDGPALDDAFDRGHLDLQVVAALVRLYVQCGDASALAVLINLMHGTSSDHDLPIANVIVKAGLFNGSVVSEGVWDVAINVATTCHEGRDAIIQSPLMGFGDASAPLRAPFMRDLQAGSMPLSLAGAIIAIMLMHERHTPPWQFVFAVWPTLMRMLSVLQPIPHDQASQQEQLMRGYVFEALYNALHYPYRGLSREQTVCRVLVLRPDTLPWLYARLAELEPHLHIDDRANCMRIFTELSSVLPHDTQRATNEAALACMFRNVESTHSVLRAQSYMWMGNYMADGVQYVAAMLKRGIMGPLLHAVRTGERNNPYVRNNAAHALMAAFASCLDNRSTSMADAAQCDAVMHSLVVDYQIFHSLGPFLGAQNSLLIKTDRDMTLDVLSILGDALQWNRAVTLAHVRDTEIGDRLDVVLNNLMGNQDNELFAAAARVADMLDDDDGEACADMAVEMAALKPGGYGF